MNLVEKVDIKNWRADVAKRQEGRWDLSFRKKLVFLLKRAKRGGKANVKIF